MKKSVKVCRSNDMFGDDQSASSGVLSIRHEPVVGMKVSVKYEDAHSDEESWHKGTIELAHEMPDGKFKVEVIFPCGYRDSTIVFPSKENDVRLLEDGIDRKKEAGEVLPKGEFHAEYEADLDATITDLGEQRRKEQSESKKAHYNHADLGEQRRKETSESLLAYHKPTWDKRIDELVKYKKENGHCKVPQGPQSGPLGTWVRHQRSNRDKLPEERVQQLDFLGFDWGPRKNQGLRGDHNRAVRHYLISAKMGDKNSVESIKNLFMDGLATMKQYAEALRGYNDAVKEMKSRDRDEAKRLRTV